MNRTDAAARVDLALAEYARAVADRACPRCGAHIFPEASDLPRRGVGMFVVWHKEWCPFPDLLEDARRLVLRHGFKLARDVVSVGPGVAATVPRRVT
ncbi:MAG TPA: hypothetical protein VNO79_09135 [Actinomycetota bacterium]|nr:hypothetical protein [Actinomycetota bacterium]